MKGKVLSSDGVPIFNARIAIVSTNEVVFSDKDGSYEIDYLSSDFFEPHIKVTKRYYKPFDLTKESDNGTIFTIARRDSTIRLNPPIAFDLHPGQGKIQFIDINMNSTDFAYMNDSLFVYLDSLDINSDISQIRMIHTQRD